MPRDENLTPAHKKAAARTNIPYFSRDDIPEEEKQAARIKGGLEGGRKRRYVRGTREPIENIDVVRANLEEVIANLKMMDQTVGVCNSLIRSLQVYAGILTDQTDREEILEEIAAIREELKLG